MADPFTARALQVYEDAGKQLGYWAYRFLGKIRRDGGLAAAKHWLRPSKATSGFARLLDYDRLDLSVEAVALQDQWRGLFTAAELETARVRLAEFGYFNRPRVSVSSGQLSPDELLDAGSMSEGGKATLTVSAYERNPKAREICIKTYGAVCYVCAFDFAKTYGEIGRGYIHVHHLTPFAGSEGPRNTDPIADLRPVCPNCHAMLHRRSPPVPIAELRQILKAAVGH